MRSRPHPALERLTAELRAEPVPELDWARLEARVLARVERPRTAPAGPRRALAPAVLAAAAVLLTLGAWYLRSAHRPIADHSPLPLVSTDLDGQRLGLGDWIETQDSPRSVQHPGRAKWTLAPHSRARLLSKGDTVTVVLEAGAVLAEVVKTGKPESFAVEVKQTRIAARGTVFTVELTGARVRVAVRQGTVVVGSTLAPGHTEGFLLSAPKAGTFSLDGARTGQIDGDEPPHTAGLPGGGPRGTVARAQSSGPAASGSTLVAGADSARPAVGEPLGSASLAGTAQPGFDAALEQVISAVNGCFAAQTPPRGDMWVSVTFLLATSFSPDGALSELSFDPPLLPAVERCSREAAAKVHAPRSEAGGAVRRTVTLHR